MSRYSTGTQTTGKEHSADQLSAVWNDNGGVVGAWPASRDGGHSWEIEVKRFESNFNLTQQINLQRGGQAASRPLSQDTAFLTTVTEFSERTRILALDGDRLALDDQDLVKWLVTAEQQVVLGTDNHPLFETSLDDTACVIRRLPNGLVAITEVPRAHILAARERVRTLIGDRVVSYVDTCIETPVRSRRDTFSRLSKRANRSNGPAKKPRSQRSYSSREPDSALACGARRLGYLASTDF
jgi:hypothetical protein